MLEGHVTLGHGGSSPLPRTTSAAKRTDVKKHYLKVKQTLSQSFLLHKKQFFSFFIMSSLGFVFVFFSDIMIVKLRIVVHYYNWPFRYFFDAWVPAIVYVGLFLVIAYYLCIMSFLAKEALFRTASRRVFPFRAAYSCFFSFILVQIRFILMVTMGGIFLVFPGAIAFFLYSLSGFAVIIDDKKGSDAFEFSRELVSKRWVQYLDYLLVFLVFLGVGLVAGFFFERLAGLLAKNGLDKIVGLIDLISFGVMILIWNSAFVYFFCIYNTFKEKLLEEENNEKVN